MNREQNIDDILKLLKDSVNTESTTDGAEHISNTSNNISTESLQEQLKNQYILDADSISTDTQDSEYMIDSDFLNSAISDQADYAPVAVAEEAEKENIQDVIESDNELEEHKQEQEIIDVFSEQADEPDEEFEMPPIFEKAFEPQEEEQEEENSVEEPEIVMQPLFVSELVTNEKREEIEAPETPDEAEIILENENVSNEDIAPEELEDEHDIQDILKEAVEPSEPHETFLASMRKIGVDFTTDEMYNSLQRTEEVPILDDSEAEEAVDEQSAESVDSSTINLMLQFCDKDELDSTVGSERVERFIHEERMEDTAPSYEKSNNSTVEHKDTERTGEQVITSMLEAKKRSGIFLLGSAALALVALIYELLPVFGIMLLGIFDYENYPAVYALIGLQLLVLCAAMRYKECWTGLKCAFSAKPDRDSVSVLVSIFTAIYDLIIILILAFTGDELPNLYNSVAILLLFACALMDYLELGAKIKVLDIYSSDAQRFTLIKQGADGNIAKKMYAGGLEAQRSVYVADEARNTQGIVSELQNKNSGNKFLSLFTIPLLALAMLCSVISVFIGADAYFACAAFMVCIYLLLPSVFIMCDGIAYAMSARRLAARGNAIASDIAAEQCADIDIIVFDDLHMFKKCKTEDIGVVIYDTKVGYLVLGCIAALYSKIGGPMSAMNIELPEVFRFDDVSIRRASRNGIEAIIDRRYSLIVGEPEFMQRYGLVFPPNESDNGRSTLCVSLDGKATAKLSVKYHTEPVFEMLAERLSEVGVSSVIQTFDPLINSSLTARSRTLGTSPVSVLHKGAAELSAKGHSTDEHTDMLVSTASRLKLAEITVWIKKLARLKKICRIIAVALAAVGAAAMTLLLVLGGITHISQAVIVAYILLQGIGMCTLMAVLLPDKKYFTVEAMYERLEREHMKQVAREQKKIDKKKETEIQ